MRAFSATALQRGSLRSSRECQATVMAEGVGFEPTVTCATPVFKTGALNRSATPPRQPASALACQRLWTSGFTVFRFRASTWLGSPGNATTPMHQTHSRPGTAAFG